MVAEMKFTRQPPRKSPRISVTNVCDEHGRPIKILPDHPSADFMRSTYRHAKKLTVDAAGGVITSSPGLVRAQIPYIVTLHVYTSKFQLTPIEQEWFLYAPGDLKSGATLALTMWKRWFKPGRKPGEAASGILMEDDYPLIADGVIVEPLGDDDKFFDECWRYVRNRPHKAAGHPDQPWLFTCLDEDFKIYKHTDRQAGLLHKIS